MTTTDRPTCGHCGAAPADPLTVEMLDGRHWFSWLFLHLTLCGDCREALKGAVASAARAFGGGAKTRR